MQCPRAHGEWSGAHGGPHDGRADGMRLALRRAVGGVADVGRDLGGAAAGGLHRLMVHCRHLCSLEGGDEGRKRMCRVVVRLRLLQAPKLLTVSPTPDCGQVLG